MVMSCPQIRSKEAKSKEDLKTLKISKAFVVNLNITKLGRGRNEERAITKVFWGGAQSVPVVAFIPIAHSIRVHKKPILPCLQLLFPSLGLLLRRSLQP